MAEIVHLNIPMMLLGTWRSQEDDARSEYHIGVEGGQLTVRARDFLDGEAYLVSNVVHDRERVEFDTLMSSTGRKGHVTLIATSRTDRAELRFTFTDIGFVARHDVDRD